LRIPMYLSDTSMRRLYEQGVPKETEQAKLFQWIQVLIFQ